MCDFLGYEIKERLRMKKFIEKKALVEERKLETTRLEERPITITQYSHNHVFFHDHYLFCAISQIHCISCIVSLQYVSSFLPEW